jgi:hypothetical protein
MSTADFCYCIIVYNPIFRVLRLILVIIITIIYCYISNTCSEFILKYSITMDFKFDTYPSSRFVYVTSLLASSSSSFLNM